MRVVNFFPFFYVEIRFKDNNHLATRSPILGNFRRRRITHPMLTIVRSGPGVTEIY